LDRDEFLKATEEAIGQVYERDRRLIDSKASERAIAHRLAVYLESSFSDSEVDCDYDPFEEGQSPSIPGIEECAESRGPDWIAPDILVHSRDSGETKCLAVFEIRRGSDLDECDGKKIEGMTSPSGFFRCQYGMGIEFYSDHYVRLLFVGGIAEGDPISTNISPDKAGAKPTKSSQEGFASRSKALMEAQATAVKLDVEARKKVGELSPEEAIERYDYLKNKSITELTEAEYAERLVLAERMSSILKEQRKKKQ
jgi:hypothetical protein